MAHGVWAPFKELSVIVNSAISQRQADSCYALENVLKKHKPDFVALLKNPPRNTLHRTSVQKATKEGVKISLLPQPLILTQDFIDQVLVVSDVLDLNELSAVELLLAGEQSQPDFPGLTRGLVAVLLYYDGRRNVVTALRSLIQAREGVSWTLGLSNMVVSIVHSFTDYLFQNGLVDKILALLREVSVRQELEKLSKARGIKDARHCQQISDLIEDQRNALGDCLFYWACQNPFPRDEVLKLLAYLKKITAEDEIQPLDYPTLSVFLSLLACFNIGNISVDSPSLDDSQVDQNYPILTDSGYLSAIHQEVIKDDWSYPALGAAMKFAWGILLRECSPLDAFRDQSEIEDDEDVVGKAIRADALRFLSRAVVGSKHFHHEEYFVRRIHELICSFIVLMPVKVTELRNFGEEIAHDVLIRTSRGISLLPRQRQDIGDLMKLVGELYQEDPNSLELCLDYWAPTETDFQGVMRSRTAHRQLSLLKFVHQCSDLLPSTLFQPFMKMLLGLSNCAPAARHCFNFLKANCPSLGGGGASAAISFDHFFASLRQYYLGLRDDSSSGQIQTGCGISPQELEGLLSVLRVIANIARLDKDAREVIYESQEWRPVASLFGLLGCGVPTILKAEIFNTLAMFARSPEIACYMWHTLEVTQIVNTGGGMVGGARGQLGISAAGREGSIQIELEEIETQMEEYPETRGFLALLDALTDVPVPDTLGLGSRVPGFQPYLEFVRDSVFLKFDSRGYKHLHEKWQVASAALEVLLKLLQNHEVTPNDFIESDLELPSDELGRVGLIRLPWKSGHSLLLHMLNDTPLLHKVLYVVDECCQVLMDVEHSSEEAAHAALLSLQMLEAALSKQENFLSVLRQNTVHALTATPLDEILLTINPRTKKANYLITIARYLCLSSHSPELALSATRILCLSCRSVYVAKEMVRSIVLDPKASAEILHGFVEHLEWDEPGFVAPPQPDSWEESVNQSKVMESPLLVRAQLKVDILKLLVFCLQKPSPTISHFLLGFDARKKMGETLLQHPGVLGCPKTCLHAVLALVAIGVNPHCPTGCHVTHPVLAELCYKLIHCMCASLDISAPTLRYLRNNHDFFFTQLKHLPFPWLAKSGSEGMSKVGPIRHIFQRQQAWVLRTIALEVRMTAVRKQRSHITRLVSYFLHPTLVTAAGERQSDITGSMMDWAREDLDPASQEMVSGQDGRRKAVTILDHVDFFPVQLPPLPDLRNFEDRSRMEEVIQQCAVVEKDEAPFVNVKVLHHLLMNELNSLHGITAISQRQTIEEIKEILSVVVQRNGINEVAHSQQLLFTSWSQLLEVTLHALVGEGGEWEEPGRITMLFDLIQDLLLKVEHCEPGQLSAAVHGTVMILMAHLRQEVTSMTHQADKSGSSLSPVHTGPLQAILRGLLDNLLQCPSTMQQMRAFLYSSLLCYFRITHDEEDSKDWNEPEMSRRWKLRQDPTGLKDGNVAVLTSFGDPLMDTVCRDACTGHDIAKMLALSLLDALASIGLWEKWLQFMMGQGYLQTLCASLQWEDEALQKMLHPVPEALRALFVHESKMAFLIRLASTIRGAQELLRANCIGHLASCSFIDQRPNMQSIVSDNNRGSWGQGRGSKSVFNTAEFVPSVAGRYLQLFIPVLRLLQAFVSTPGPQQKEARSQVMSFITTHLDVFVSVLKESHTPITIATLRELSLVTSIVSRCRAGHDFSMLPDSARLIHLQRHMLSLLPHYLTLSSWKAIALDIIRTEEGEEALSGRGFSIKPLRGWLWEEAVGLAQRISGSLVAYCSAAMNTGDSSMAAQRFRILFRPQIAENFGAQALQKEMYTSSKAPSLSLLVVALCECSDGYVTILESLQQLRKKKESMESLPVDELKQFVPDSVPDKSKLSSSQVESLASHGLSTLVLGKEQQLHQITYIVDHLLCLLWRHLQFYLVHCKPTELESSLSLPIITQPGMRKMQKSKDKASDDKASADDVPSPSLMMADFDMSQISEGVKMADLEQLKVDVVKVMTDSLFKKLLDLSEAHAKEREGTATMGVSFIQALVRRIKRLLKLKAAVKPVWQL